MSAQLHCVVPALTEMKVDLPIVIAMSTILKAWKVLRELMACHGCAPLLVFEDSGLRMEQRCHFCLPQHMHRRHRAWRRVDKGDCDERTHNVRCCGCLCDTLSPVAYTTFHQAGHRGVAFPDKTLLPYSWS